MFERTEATADLCGRVTGDVPGGGRFTVHDHGAHVTEWTPDDTPVLWTSEYARFVPKVGIRGGMPICFPWFANGRRGHKTPAHGFARLSPWKLRRALVVGGVTKLEWQLTPEMIPEIEGVDPDRNNFDVRCLQQFDETLTVTLRIRNTDSHPLVVEEALHTYFHVADIGQVLVHGLTGAEYLDKLTGAYDTQIGPVRFEGEVDRVYWAGGTIEIHDPVLGRAIVVTSANSANTVVWNPWIDKAAQMSDFGDDEWTGMVCVETANVRDNVLHLNPGQAHDMAVHISVREL
jgi:glucose-6-phosphate 1-epimerase